MTVPAPAVSVVIPTEGARPGRLALALMALGFQRMRDFEVVIAGPPGCLDAPALAPWRARLRHVPAPAGNVAAARNAAIAAAAGQLIAFLDDDAVPEPGWLDALCAGFLAPDVGGVGGVVLGPNGVDWEAQGLAIDACGRERPVDAPQFGPPVIPDLPPGWVVKTPGTCCAFRRDALVAAGGFDAAFRFFHDETDLDRRLAALGWRLALAPRAVVHHAAAPSARRGPRGVPHDLFEVGAAVALFLRRHAPEGMRAAALAEFRARRRASVLRRMLAGLIEPPAAARLLQGLDAGIADGLGRPFATGLPGDGPAAAPPVRFAPARGPVRRLCFPCRRGIPPEARAAAQAGAEVTVIRLGWGVGRLTVRFEPPGIWVHAGGALGRARRGEWAGPRAGRAGRMAAERARAACLRGPFDADPPPVVGLQHPGGQG